MPDVLHAFKSVTLINSEIIGLGEIEWANLKDMRSYINSIIFQNLDYKFDRMWSFMQYSIQIFGWIDNIWKINFTK